MSANLQAWELVQIVLTNARLAYVIATKYLSYRESEVLRFLSILNFFLSSYSVLENKFPVDSMVHSLYNWLSVILKIFEAFAPNIEVKSLVIVAGNNDPIF